MLSLLFVIRSLIKFLVLIPVCPLFYQHPHKPVDCNERGKHKEDYGEVLAYVRKCGIFPPEIQVPVSFELITVYGKAPFDCIFRGISFIQVLQECKNA